MVPLISVVVIAFVAWQYRRVLDLSKRRDGFGPDYARDLASRLGWTNPTDAVSLAIGSQSNGGPAQAPQRSSIPTIDRRRLPAALAIATAQAVVVLALYVSGHELLAVFVGIVIGPFLGGIYVRSLWWLPMTALMAIAVGAGVRVTPLLVAVPVAAIGYAGIRTDIAGWIARLNAKPQERS